MEVQLLEFMSGASLWKEVPWRNPLNHLGKSLETHMKPKKGGFTSATSVIRADGDVLSIGHT